MAVQRSVRLRRWSLALGSSIVAMGMASSVQAQCSPEPTVRDGTTTCTGTDIDGLMVDTPNTRVVVADGAVVRAGSGDAAITTRELGPNFDIRGQVDGGSKTGMLISTHSFFITSPVYTMIAVAAGGEVKGAEGIVVRRAPTNIGGDMITTITNAGRLTGTTGAAIVVSSDNLSYGSISRPLSLTNSGTITGVGTAIDSNGVIALVNTGTIQGSVIVREPGTSGQNSSTVDTLGGTIVGDLVLGASDDVLQARYDNGRVVTGVTGLIDGGDGIDTLRFRIDANTVISDLVLPTRFEQLGLALASNPTITLADGVTAPLVVEGSGSIVNDSTLVGTTRVMSQKFLADGSINLLNNGTLRTTAAGGTDVFAVDLRAGSFRNAGTVDAAGNGVRYWAAGPFINTGLVQATGTAVSLFGSSFDNSGTVRSTAGTGAILSGSSGSNWVNNGIITGAVAGVELSSTLVNTGTLSSPRTAVVLSSYGILDNRASGIVTGDGAAIAPLWTNSDIFNAAVANAGTINGSVTLGSRPINVYYNDNYFFALPGGMLNGNLTLGGGDTLITELTNTGPGAFAGITGVVNATDSLLRYRVRANASAVATRPDGFIKLGYDLFDNAALTLTGASTPLTFAGTGSVDVSGDIVAGRDTAISTTGLRNPPGITTMPAGNKLAITSRGTLTLERLDSMQYSNAAVAIGSDDTFTNAGTITVIDRATPVYNTLTAIRGGTIVNDGTLSLGGADGISASSVINSGTIVQIAGERNARGIINTYGPLTVINKGTIDVAGDAVTGGYGMNVDNSGRIASSSGIAIDVDNYGSATIFNRAGATIAGNGDAIRVSGGMLDNAGTITGNVDLGYSWGRRSYNGAIYVARGGTVTGNLLFGNGNDTLVVYDDVTGVSGSIDGGDGEDTYIHARTTSGTVTLANALPTGFELEGVRAYGANTVVTIAGNALSGIGTTIGGTGSIVNTVNFDGKVDTGSRYLPVPSADTPILASFTNQAALGDGFHGSALHFVNASTGTITSKTAPDAAVDISQATAIDFVNDGKIDLGAGDVAISLFSQTQIGATNNGTVLGGVSLSTQNRTNVVTAQPLTISLVNTGTITGQGYSTPVDMLLIEDSDGSTSLTLDNRGTIEATGVGSTAARLEAGGGYYSQPVTGARQITVANSGAIRANAGGRVVTYTSPFSSQTESYVESASALNLYLPNETNPTIGTITVTNTATGTIEATGALSTAVISYGGALDLTNAGTIRGGGGFREDYFGVNVAGAIDSQFAATNDRIVNTGTIIGSIATGAGDDRIENYGTITGDVFLGDGDDTFLHRA